jgi:hypothetical protein
VTVAKQKNQSDPDLELILDTLRRDYLPRHPKAKIDAYRYSPWSIRVRIIDPGLKGSRITARDGEVWDILRPLPDDTVGQISLLILLTPQETRTSIANMEFEDPTPSQL